MWHRLWRWCVPALLSASALRQSWPLLASQFKCFSLSVPGSLRAFLFPSTDKEPETWILQARYSWKLLCMSCCGCLGCQRHLEILSPLHGVISSHVWEFVAAPFLAIPLVKKKCMGTAFAQCWCCYPRIAELEHMYPCKAFTQAFWLHCRLHLRGFSSWQALVGLRPMVELSGEPC